MRVVGKGRQKNEIRQQQEQRGQSPSLLNARSINTHLSDHLLFCTLRSGRFQLSIFSTLICVRAITLLRSGFLPSLKHPDPPLSIPALPSMHASRNDGNKSFKRITKFAIAVLTLHVAMHICDFSCHPRLDAVPHMRCNACTYCGNKTLCFCESSHFSHCRTHPGIPSAQTLTVLGSCLFCHALFFFLCPNRTPPTSNTHTHNAASIKGQRIALFPLNTAHFTWFQVGDEWRTEQKGPQRKPQHTNRSMCLRAMKGWCLA